MNSTDPIPQNITRFLDTYVESMEQLEILRILGENTAKTWTAPDLATAGQIRPGEINAHVTVLQGRGLLKAEWRQAVLCCSYGPSTVDIEKELRELLQFYREKPVTLIRAMYSRSADRLKAFADSFRFRKGD